MTADPFPFNLIQTEPPRIGLIALQSDETIETDFRRLIPREASLMVSRVPSAPEVSNETLAAMEHHLTASAALFPEDLPFDSIGYGCTSGSAQIGPDTIASRIHAGAKTRSVTEPVTALTHACQSLGLTRLAFLSPYIAPVSQRLRDVLGDQGIQTPYFGSFDVAEEAKVARIDAGSIIDAAVKLVQSTDAEALFLSCTNLRTLDIIPDLEARLKRPVLSSNQVLAWHLMTLSTLKATADAPGQLFQS